MFQNPRLKWYVMAMSLIVVCGGGLILGKSKERDYLSSLYERRDFTLLDDQGEFFRLNSLPERKLALLMFTPDGIPQEAVKPTYEFGKHLGELRDRGIETFLVSRTHREIVRNFKSASHFSARLLLDMGGVVGRNAGAWESTAWVKHWAYALVDREFHVLWQATADEPIPYEQLIEELKKAR